MNYSKQEVMDYVKEEDVKFIRLAFCDVFGKQKNISIMPDELRRAFEYGIAFDASAINGFGGESRSDLFLHPDPESLTLLPWRPEHGRVVRMFSSITYPDGTLFECDTRSLLKKAVKDAAESGYSFSFGAEQEFYLLKLDDKNEPTDIPYDHAGYMDIAPDDRCENIRREVCLMLEQMGIRPESSHHEEGPGQCEIDFRYSDALTAADNAITFQNIVKTVARRNGLYADFSAKPLEKYPGNGFHINISVRQRGSGQDQCDINDMRCVIAGLLEKIDEMTVFLDPTDNSYLRLGQRKAPGYVTWSNENRSQLIRVPAAVGEYRRAELRSPDPSANPYIAFSLVIYAGLHGLKSRPELPGPADVNIFAADNQTLAQYRKLPGDLKTAQSIASKSAFINDCLPERIIRLYCGG